MAVSVSTARLHLSCGASHGNACSRQLVLYACFQCRHVDGQGFHYLFFSSSCVGVRSFAELSARWQRVVEEARVVSIAAFVAATLDVISNSSTSNIHEICSASCTIYPSVGRVIQEQCLILSYPYTPPTTWDVKVSMERLCFLEQHGLSPSNFLRIR